MSASFDGFIQQIFIAMLEILQRDDLKNLTLEPKEEHAVIDLKIETNIDNFELIQIKKRSDPVGENEIKKWIREINDKYNNFMNQKELILIGTISGPCKKWYNGLKDSKHDNVKINIMQNWDFDRFNDRIILSLMEYIEKMDLELLPKSLTPIKYIVSKLKWDFIERQIISKTLTKDEFDKIIEKLILDFRYDENVLQYWPEEKFQNKLKDFQYEKFHHESQKSSYDEINFISPIFEKKETKSIDINELIRFEKKIKLITGDAGIGKTTLLFHLMKIFLENKDRSVIPIYFKCCELIDFGDQNLEDIVNCIKSHLMISERNFCHFKQILSNKKIILILDSIDEFYCNCTENSFSINRYFKSLSRFCDFYNVMVIISTRPAIINRISVIESRFNTEVFSLKPWSEEMIFEYLYRKENILAANLIIENIENIKDIIRNPIYLHFAYYLSVESLKHNDLNLFNSGIKINRSSFLEKLIQKMIDYDKKSIPQDIDLSPEEYLNLFRLVAITQMSEEKDVNLAKLDFKNLLPLKIENLLNYNEAIEIIKNMKPSPLKLYFLTNSGCYGYFKHRILAEYLIAETVFQEIKLKGKRNIKTGTSLKLFRGNYFTLESMKILKEIIKNHGSSIENTFVLNDFKEFLSHKCPLNIIEKTLYWLDSVVKYSKISKAELEDFISDLIHNSLHKQSVIIIIGRNAINNYQDITNLIDLDDPFQYCKLIPNIFEILDTKQNINLMLQNPLLEAIVLTDLDITYIPDEIWCLKNLKYLAIVNCWNLEEFTFLQNDSIESLYIRGCKKITCIDDSIENLHSLEEISLDSCSIVKISPIVGNLMNLKEIKINECLIENLPDFSNIINNINGISLTNCKLLEKIPDSLFKQSNLNYIILINLPLLKRLPKSFNSLTNLKVLDLERLPKIDALPHLNNNRSLVRIKIRDFPELRNLPSGIESLSHLESLSLTNLPKIKKIFAKRSDNGALKAMFLEGLEEFEDLSDIFSLENLEILTISKCMKLTQFPKKINFCNLKILWIEDSNLSLINDPKIELFKTLRDLQIKNSSDNWKTNKSDFKLNLNFKNLMNLENLEISGYKYIKQFDDSIGNLPKLEYLNLSRNGITELPISISNLKLLKNLNISNCENLIRLPDKFGELKLLRKLKLNGCKNLKYLPNSFISLNSLFELDLDSCEKLNTLPQDFDKLRRLSILYLNYCKSLRIPVYLLNMPNINKIRIDGISHEINQNFIEKSKKQNRIQINPI